MIIALKLVLIINFITIFIFGIDKIAAIDKSSRVSEEILLILSLFGGAIGASIAMLLFHHKTSKKKFNKTIPILAVIYLVLIAVVVFKTI